MWVVRYTVFEKSNLKVKQWLIFEQKIGEGKAAKYFFLFFFQNQSLIDILYNWNIAFKQLPKSSYFHPPFYRVCATPHKVGYKPGTSDRQSDSHLLFATPVQWHHLVEIELFRSSNGHFFLFTIIIQKENKKRSTIDRSACFEHYRYFLAFVLALDNPRWSQFFMQVMNVFRCQFLTQLTHMSNDLSHCRHIFLSFVILNPQENYYNVLFLWKLWIPT